MKMPLRLYCLKNGRDHNFNLEIGSVQRGCFEDCGGKSHKLDLPAGCRQHFLAEPNTPQANCYFICIPRLSLPVPGA